MTDIELIEALRECVLEGPGRATPANRQAAAAYAADVAAKADASCSLESPVAEWASKVAKNAYKTVDADVAALKEAGLSEDEIFELTVATALGAAHGRYERAMAAIDEGYES